MSLEQSIEKLTAALTANTAALLAGSQPQAKAPAQPKASATPTPPQTPVSPPAAQSLTYADVVKVVADFVKANGRAPGVLLLESVAPAHTTIVPFKEKPAELALIYAVFTDPVKTAAAIAAAKEAKAAAK